MTAAPGDGLIEDRTDRRQYELHVEGETATITYRLASERITFIHTRVPPALEGRGIAARLARYVLDDARRRGLAVVPICPYVAGFIKRHPDYRDLVPDWAQERYLTDSGGK